MTVDRRERWAGEPPRMREVSHVHAEHDPRAWHWFARGPVVAADGGERADGSQPSSDRRSDGGRPEADEGDERRERNVEGEALRDVDHEPTHGEGAGRVWERGDEDDGE